MSEAVKNQNIKEPQTPIPKKIEEELEKLKQERDKYLQDWQKARAELINYKKDEEKRAIGIIKFSNERIMKELIAVLDSFELAIQSLENSDEAKNKEKYLKGVYLIRDQLKDLMFREGLEEIAAAKEGMPDLASMEIVSEIETDETPAGSIVLVIQKGYKFNGKIIRPVRVAVAKIK